MSLPYRYPNLKLFTIYLMYEHHVMIGTTLQDVSLTYARAERWREYEPMARYLVSVRWVLWLRPALRITCGIKHDTGKWELGSRALFGNLRNLYKEQA